MRYLGHEYADAMLRMLADMLQHQTRKSDFAACLRTSRLAAIFYKPQPDFVTRQKDNAATNGEVYCTLSCAMTYVDAENDSRVEDTVSRVENVLRSVKKLGGNQLAVIEPRDKDGKPPAAGKNLNSSSTQANPLVWP